MEHTYDIEEISKKIFRTIGVLKKLQLTVPKNILLSIFFNELFGYLVKKVDSQKVGHFLITKQKSFKLIINQLWT